MHRQSHAKRQNRARAAGQIADARLPSIHLPPAPTAPNLTLTPTDARRDAQERCHGRPCYACAKSALTPPVGFARRPPFRAWMIEYIPMLLPDVAESGRPAEWTGRCARNILWYFTSGAQVLLFCYKARVGGGRLKATPVLLRFRAILSTCDCHGEVPVSSLLCYSSVRCLCVRRHRACHRLDYFQRRHCPRWLHSCCYRSQQCLPWPPHYR